MAVLTESGAGESGAKQVSDAGSGLRNQLF